MSHAWAVVQAPHIFLSPWSQDTVYTVIQVVILNTNENNRMTPGRWHGQRQ